MRCGQAIELFAVNEALSWSVVLSVDWSAAARPAPAAGRAVSVRVILSVTKTQLSQLLRLFVPFRSRQIFTGDE